ncbi:hypothetical protein Kpho02_59680 [Kitasatospora phosalacinea]|uniref:Uncharacterized protein n=1 Tax=Kitasatospora phosalacinea TaxID=2065 RepID=A0A9W6V2X9_9ACTN|nr:hypothetical protein [Kitasatospora phosalacinea]GLW73669.1 hypothetical protein Kpho02_59680 [Kitasatospora phosalacinea]
MPSTTRYSPEPSDLLPPIVTICGSTRFWRHIAEAALQETVAGRMVLAPAVDMRQHHELWDDPAAAEQLKARLDALHLAKISTADEVLVVTDDRLYLGESTRREILFAEALEIPVSYWVAGRGRLGTSHLQQPSAARERARQQWRGAFARLTEASPTGPSREDLLTLAAADLAVAEHGTAASLVDVRRAARQHLGIDIPHDRAQAALTVRTQDSPGANIQFLLGPASR